MFICTCICVYRYSHIYVHIYGTETKIVWYKNETCISVVGLRQRLYGTRMRLASV